ncbi:hypothetical protein ABFX02_08G190200 [Erythranthe guttata]
MAGEFSDDFSQLLEAASEISGRSGALSDASAEKFLARFPPRAIINALQACAGQSGPVDAIINTLEKVYGTEYGANLILQKMPSVLAGLGDDSEEARRLACTAGKMLLLALIVRLFSVSRSVASRVWGSGLLSLLVAEVRNEDETEVEVRNEDETEVNFSVLDLIDELVGVAHSAEFVLKTSLICRIGSIIGTGTKETRLKSRAKMIAWKFLSGAYIDDTIPRSQRTFKTMFTDLESEFKTVDKKSDRGIKLKKFISMFQSMKKIELEDPNIWMLNFMTKQGLEDNKVLITRESRIRRVTRGSGRHQADFFEMVEDFLRE